MGRHTRFARTSTKHCLNKKDTYPAEGSAYHESAFQTRTPTKADQTIFQAHIHNHMPPNLQADWGGGTYSYILCLLYSCIQFRNVPSRIQFDTYSYILLSKISKAILTHTLKYCILDSYILIIQMLI